MSLAKEMWDYLKSIGFEDIPNDDERLALEHYWDNNIAYESLCAFRNVIDGDYLMLMDKTKTGMINVGVPTDASLNIRSVSDLEGWLRKEYPSLYKEKTSMINKDNIQAVLKYNNFMQDGRVFYKNTTEHRFHLQPDDYIIIIDDLDNRQFGFRGYNFESFLEILQFKCGALEHLPSDNPFNVVKVGQWVRCIKNTILEDYADPNEYRTVNKWYQREHSSGSRYCFMYIGDDYRKWTARSYEDWDLTDIRDYNPDEVLAVVDEVELSCTYRKIKEFDYDRKIIYFIDDSYCSFDYPFKSANGRQGKFVIPPFDFRYTLLNNGFITDGRSYFEGGGIALLIDEEGEFFSWRGGKYKQSPANAAILIKASNSFGELEEHIS